LFAKTPRYLGGERGERKNNYLIIDTIINTSVRKQNSLQRSVTDIIDMFIAR